MGCASSKANVFQIINVNDQSESIVRGRLKITETNIIFHQDRKQPTTWPLNSLRWYKHDSELFSFESGRRCPTGEGTYTFKCKKPKDFFNLVQTKIQVCVNIIPFLQYWYYMYCIVQNIFLIFFISSCTTNQVYNKQMMQCQDILLLRRILLQRCRK